MRRPSAAREALRVSPPMKTGGADASRIKGIPRMTALTEPVIFLAGRPAAQGTADAWIGGTLAFLRVEFVIQNSRPGSDMHEVGVPFEQSNAQSSLCNRNGVYLRSPLNLRLGGSLWLPK
jgi:hypothetical protein